MTRHNIGFLLLDFWAREKRIKFRSFASYEEAFDEKNNLFLVKPLLYINNSGVVVKEYLGKRPDDFLVICDDVNLPFGEIRFKKRGGDGGHRGLGSIIYHLATEKFARLRIGIGKPPASPADYVLSEFSLEEKENLPQIFRAVADGLALFLKEGIDRAMSRFNRKRLLK